MSRFAAHRFTTAFLTLSSAAMVVLSLTATPADAGWNRGRGGAWAGVQHGGHFGHGGWGHHSWRHGGWGHGNWGRGGWGHHGWGHSGWRRGGTSFGFSLGLNLTPGYVVRPPVIHVPPPVVHAPAPLVVAPTSPTYLGRSGRYCREFQANGVIGGRRVPIHGMACQEPDGTWRVMR